MNIKILRKMLLFLIVLLGIIITIIITIKETNNNEQEEERFLGSDVIGNYAKECNEGVDDQTYFDIKENIQNYLELIMSENDGKYNLEDNKVSTRIYNLLSNNFISKNNIVMTNLKESTKEEESIVFIPAEISVLQSDSIKSFLVEGLIFDPNTYKLKDKIFLIMNIKDLNFSIEHINGKYKNISEIKVDKLEKNIIPNENNRLVITNVLFENVAEEYINLYKYLAIGAPEKLYERLDQEYKDAKFANLEEFKKYIEKNKGEIITINISKYNRKNEDGNIRYVCIDKNENTYVINQNGAFTNYTMLLDIYTKDVPEFIEKYDKSQVHEKVSLNIKKLIQATKDGDYKYVYSKINDSFKNTNFKTQKDFEKFIKNKYTLGDTIKYTKYEEITGLHIYHIEITKKENKEKINAKIIMKLKDNRDFEISFSAEN